MLAEFLELKPQAPDSDSLLLARWPAALLAHITDLQQANASSCLSPCPRTDLDDVARCLGSVLELDAQFHEDVCFRGLRSPPNGRKMASFGVVQWTQVPQRVGL